MAGEYNKPAATPAPISGKILFLRVARLMRGQLRHEITFLFTVIVKNCILNLILVKQALIYKNKNYFIEISIILMK